MLDNPGRELSLVVPRVMFLYRHGRAAYGWGRISEKGKTEPLFDTASDEWLFTASDWHFYAILVMGLAGTITALLHAARSHVVLTLTMAWVTGLHAVVLFGDSRFHFPLLPVLATLSGGFLAWLTDRRSRSTPKQEPARV